MSDVLSPSYLRSLLFIICFVIGCTFIYLAVQYWVSYTFDSNRYDISKIQPAGGGDSLSFWKVDHRMGNIEYCSLTLAREGSQDFTCITARSLKPVEKSK